MKDKKEVFIIVYRATEQKEVYSEDDNGNEQVYLYGTTKILTRETTTPQKDFEDIGELNANNPPYDIFEVIAVFNKDTREEIPLISFYNSERIDEDL